MPRFGDFLRTPVVPSIGQAALFLLVGPLLLLIHGIVLTVDLAIWHRVRGCEARTICADAEAASTPLAGCETLFSSLDTYYPLAAASLAMCVYRLILLFHVFLARAGKNGPFAGGVDIRTHEWLIVSVAYQVLIFFAHLPMILGSGYRVVFLEFQVDGEEVFPDSVDTTGSGLLVVLCGTCLLSAALEVTLFVRFVLLLRNEAADRASGRYQQVATQEH